MFPTNPSERGGRHFISLHAAYPCGSDRVLLSPHPKDSQKRGLITSLIIISSMNMSSSHSFHSKAKCFMAGRFCCCWKYTLLCVRGMLRKQKADKHLEGLAHLNTAVGKARSQGRTLSILCCLFGPYAVTVCYAAPRPWGIRAHNRNIRTALFIISLGAEGGNEQQTGKTNIYGVLHKHWKICLHYFIYFSQVLYDHPIKNRKKGHFLRAKSSQDEPVGTCLHPV